MLKFESKEFDKYDKLISEGKYLNGKWNGKWYEKEKVKYYNYTKKFDFNNIRDYVYKYGKEIGLPNLRLKVFTNVCSLKFDGKIDVDIIYLPNIDQCIFASPICTIPKKHKEKFYRTLLISNAFGIENGGAVFSIDKFNEKRIALSFTFIASTFSYELFKTVLGNFVTMVENKMLQVGKEEYYINTKLKFGGKNLKNKKELSFHNTLNKYISF